MTIRVASWYLLSASMILAPLHLRADPPATDHAQRYELFSSVTGRWAKVNELDPLKPMMGDHVVVAVSADESFEVELSRVTESPDGLNVFWTSRLVNNQYGEVFVTFIRYPGTAKASFDSGYLTVPNQQRAFVFQAEKQRPGWVLVSEVKPGAADLSCDTRDACKEPATKP